MTDEYMDKALTILEQAFERYGEKKNFSAITGTLMEIVKEARQIIDPKIQPKPLIGIVGEIYLRTHTPSNQDLIRTLEKHGAEVVNASIVEWVNFISYNDYKETGSKLRLNLKQLRFSNLMDTINKAIKFRAELFYQEMRQKQIYERVRQIIDIAADHRVNHLERLLSEEDLFSFEVGTEACLSISGIMEYAYHGF
jgi:predicted nucleotide-binding protein (sugar kinase/HSP70/actin superfamily)